VVDNRRNRSRAAGQSCAGKTIERAYATRGYEHLRGVPMSIVETKHNKRMLISPVIWAVSDVLYCKPEWLGDSWFKALDEIELGALYERAKASRQVAAPRAAMAIMIFNWMRASEDSKCAVE
jgi:hypothetical protein